MNPAESLSSLVGSAYKSVTDVAKNAGNNLSQLVTGETTTTADSIGNMGGSYTTVPSTSYVSQSSYSNASAIPYATSTSTSSISGSMGSYNPTSYAPPSGGNISSTTLAQPDIVTVTSTSGNFSY